MNLFKDFIEFKSAQFHQQIQLLLKKYRMIASDLFQTLNYVLTNPGKHIRPLIIYCVGESLEIQENRLHALAVAIELIHIYSLIHDDLPAMDNGELRRGKPCCHLVYGEAEAILAGDALQMLAIEVLAHAPYLSAKQKIQLIAMLTHAAGAAGMVGGQSLDIASEGKTLTLDEISKIHRLKTGKLIEASILMPTVISTKSTNQELSTLATLLGIAYQIQDDLLDVESTTATLGKKTNVDISLQKNTYPKILGLDETKKYLSNIKLEIQQILEENHLLHTRIAQLIDYIFSRQH